MRKYWIALTIFLLLLLPYSCVLAMASSGIWAWRSTFASIALMAIGVALFAFQRMRVALMVAGALVASALAWAAVVYVQRSTVDEVSMLRSSDLRMLGSFPKIAIASAGQTTSCEDPEFIELLKRGLATEDIAAVRFKHSASCLIYSFGYDRDDDGGAITIPEAENPNRPPYSSMILPCLWLTIDGGKCMPNGDVEIGTVPVEKFRGKGK